MNGLIGKNVDRKQIARIGSAANMERGLTVFKGAVESKNIQEEHVPHFGAISRMNVPNIMGILSQFNGRIDRLNEEISRINSKIGKKVKKKERYEAEADRISEHYRACLSRISVLEVKIAVKIGEIDALNDRIKELDSSIEGVNEIGRIVKEKMGRTDEKMHAAISAFEKGMRGEDLADMAAEIAKLKKEAKAGSSEKDKLAEDLDFEKSRAIQFTVEIDNPLVARDEISSEIAKLNSRIEKMEAEKKAEAEKIDFVVKKSGIDALERVMKKLNRDNDALRASVAELQKHRDLGMHAKDQSESLEKVRGESARLAEINHNLSMEIDSMKERIQNALSLENQNAELAVTINRVRDELTLAKNGYDSLEHEIIEKNEVIATLNDSLRLQSDRVNALTRGVAPSSPAPSLRLEAIEASNRQLEKERSELEATVATLRDQLSAQAVGAPLDNPVLLSHLKELESANGQLVSENSDLRAMADALKDQLKSQNEINNEMVKAITEKIQLISKLEDQLMAKATPATEAPSDPVSSLRRDSLEEMSGKYARLKKKSESTEKALNAFLDEINGAMSDGGFFTKGRLRNIVAKFHDQYHNRCEKDSVETARKPDGESKEEETR